MFQFVVRVFLSLTQHGVGLRNSEAIRAVNCSFGPARLWWLPLGERRIRVGDSDSVRTKSVEGVVFPGSWTTWVLSYIEIRQLTLPHAVEILATTVR